MRSEKAALLIRRWVDRYGRTVVLALARYGVNTAADRADLEQEVFVTAFLFLLSGETIGDPIGWLTECARRKASNHRRKEGLRALHAGEEADGEVVASPMVSPAQLAEDREALFLAFDCIDQESQDIVVAIRAEGLSWDAVAAERGMTIDRVRHIYALAVMQMEAILERRDSGTNKHRAIAFPILLKQVFDDINAEVDNTSPELERRVREGLDRFMESAGAGPPDPEGERISVAQPSPTSPPSTSPPAPPMTVGPVLGILGGGIVVGVVLGYLLHGALPDKPSDEPSRARSTPILARIESSERTSAEASESLLPAKGSRPSPGELLARSRPTVRSGTAADPSRVAIPSASQMLLDRARAALRAGNARAALALLVEHAHSFPEKLDEGARPDLLQLVCAASAVRDATACADMRSSKAL